MISHVWDFNFAFFFIPKICAIQLIASDRRGLKEQRTCWLKACAPGLRGRMAESLDKIITERGDNDFSKQHFHKPDMIPVTCQIHSTHKHTQSSAYIFIGLKSHQ